MTITPLPRSALNCVLKASDLALTYDGEPAFAGVHLTVDAGERVGLVGPSGAGTSSLLRVLAGRRRRGPPRCVIISGLSALDGSRPVGRSSGGEQALRTELTTRDDKARRRPPLLLDFAVRSDPAAAVLVLDDLAVEPGGHVPGSVLGGRPRWRTRPRDGRERRRQVDVARCPRR